jgi:hypothetical protein
LLSMPVSRGIALNTAHPTCRAPERQPITCRRPDSPIRPSLVSSGAP